MLVYAEKTGIAINSPGWIELIESRIIEMDKEWQKV